MRDLNQARRNQWRAHHPDRSGAPRRHGGNARHQGVAARVDAAQRVQHLEDVLDTLSEPPLLLVLDGVQDPHNLGACLRSADAFGVHAVIAPERPRGRITATVGKRSPAARRKPCRTSPSPSRAHPAPNCRNANIWVVGAAGEAEHDLNGFKHAGALAWVLGAEGEGLPPPDARNLRRAGAPSRCWAVWKV